VFAGLLAAQITSRLTGSVVDTPGLAVPGATVDVFLPGGKQPILITVTSAEGLFAFTEVSAGTYDAIVSFKGFEKSTERGVILVAGTEMALPAVHLEIGSVTNVVEMNETALTVQTTTDEIAPAISRPACFSALVAHALPRERRQSCAVR
jgi:hypothetical protein